LRTLHRAAKHEPTAAASDLHEVRMNVKIFVHEAEEGGYWAEVPALPGCVSQGDTMDELLANMREAIQAWLDTAPPDTEPAESRQVVELSV
jgi:predicted RNase H-like HicB family nuclease